MKLIRNSVCDEDSKTVHCCDRNKEGFVPEITDFSVIGGRVRWLLKYIVEVMLYAYVLTNEQFPIFMSYISHRRKFKKVDNGSQMSKKKNVDRT